MATVSRKIHPRAPIEIEFTVEQRLQRLAMLIVDRLEEDLLEKAEKLPE